MRILLQRIFHNEGGGRRDDGGVGELDGLACEDVASGLQVGGDLRVVGPRDGFRLRGVVHIDEDFVGVVVAEEAVGVVTAEEVHCAAVMDYILVLSPLEEGLGIVVKLSELPLRNCFSTYRNGGGGTAFLGEKINLVAFPAARKIHPQLTVALVRLTGGEPHLVPIEYLRDSTDCGQKSVGDL